VNKRQRARLSALLPGGIPRWVRCYDNGGISADRYTVVYTGHYAGKARGWCQYVGMSAAPFHPQGFCQHGEHSEMIDAPGIRWAPAVGRRCHLGLRIRFDDLPPDCQKVVLQDYQELWNLPSAEYWQAVERG
jgi:hypothetical protein